MDQHVQKIKVLEEIELLNGKPARYSRFPWVLPEDADEAYFEFYMPSYNKAYSETCGYAGDSQDPTTQIARPPYYWDAEMKKWYPSGPIPHAPTDSELVYQNSDWDQNPEEESHSFQIHETLETGCLTIDLSSERITSPLRSDSNISFVRIIDTFGEVFNFKRQALMDRKNGVTTTTCRWVEITQDKSYPIDNY